MSNEFNLLTAKTSQLCFEITKDGIKENKNIELVQFLKYSIDDNKKPVYGFTNQSFSKTIPGKRIVSGIIGIKKTTRDIIGQLIKDAKSTEISTDEVYMYQVLKGENVQKLANENYTSEDTTVVNNFFDKYLEKLKTRVTEIQSKNEDDFLDIEKQFGGLSPIILKIYKNDTNAKEPAFLCKNVTFVKKEGTITVSENTVLETYSFIANC